MIANKELRGRDLDVEVVGEGRPEESMGCWIEKTLQNNLKEYGNMNWMTDLSTGRSFTYVQLMDSISRIGCALRKRGFHPGNRVLFMANNHIEIAMSYLAIWSIEGCCASLGLSSFSDEIIRSKTVETEAKFILTDTQRAARFESAIRGLSGVKVIVIGGRVDNCISFDDLLLEENFIEDGHNKDYAGSSAAWIGFSSGTTGGAKGIMHSQAIMQLFTKSRRSGAAPNPGERKFETNGMIHGAAVCGFLDNICGFGHAFILSENATAESILKGIHQSKATTVCMYAHEVIEIFKLTTEHKLEYDLSSVQILKVPGTNLLPIYKQRLAELIPNLRQITNNYAQTETLALTAPIARSPSRMAFLDLLKGPLSSSAGKVFPLVKLKFVDLNTGEKLGPNEIGEIAAKTPFITKGYLNKPVESAKMIHADGWYHTGDVGCYDADGHIFIMGRISELIIYRTKYVFPIKIEQQMSLHPAVKDVAVIGVHHDEDRTRPVAFVSLINPQDESKALLQDIKAFTNERVLDEEKIRGDAGILFVDSIPRNDVGKILRNKLAQLLLRG